MSSEIETEDRVNPDSIIKFDDLKEWVEVIEKKVYIDQKFEIEQMCAEVCSANRKSDVAAKLVKDSLKFVCRVCAACLILIVTLATYIAYGIFF